MIQDYFCHEKSVLCENFKEVINISEQLIDKRMVDIDDLLDFLLNKRELVIGDDYYKSINPKNQLQELHLSSDFLGEYLLNPI